MPTDEFINQEPPFLDKGCESKLLTYKFPKARKEYVCNYCKKKIEKGEKYAYMAFREPDFTFTKRRECSECYG